MAARLVQYNVSSIVCTPVFSYFCAPSIYNFQNWPGCGGRAPLVVEASELQLYFHSDGSVEDWGYYLTATPSYPEKAQSLPRAHWLVSLEFELVQCMSALAAVMVNGLPRKEELEEPLSAWMENALIR